MRITLELDANPADVQWLVREFRELEWRLRARESRGEIPRNRVPYHGFTHDAQADAWISQDAAAREPK